MKECKECKKRAKNNTRASEVIERLLLTFGSAIYISMALVTMLVAFFIGGTGVYLVNLFKHNSTALMFLYVCAVFVAWGLSIIVYGLYAEANKLEEQRKGQRENDTTKKKH